MYKPEGSVAGEGALALVAIAKDVESKYTTAMLLVEGATDSGMRSRHRYALSMEKLNGAFDTIYTAGNDEGP